MRGAQTLPPLLPCQDMSRWPPGCVLHPFWKLITHNTWFNRIRKERVLPNEMHLHMINPKDHEFWCSSEKVESRVSLFIQLRHAGWKLIPFWTMMTTHWMSWRRRCWKVPKRDSAAWLLTDSWEWVGAVADWKQSSEKPKEACFRGALIFSGFFKQEENLGIPGHANWKNGHTPVN